MKKIAMTNEEKFLGLNRAKLFKKIVPLIPPDILDENRKKFFAEGFVSADWLRFIFSANLKKEELDEIITLMENVSNYQTKAPHQPRSSDARSENRGLATKNRRPKGSHPWRASYS